MAVISQDLYSKSVEVINNNLYDFGISIDDKKASEIIMKAREHWFEDDNQSNPEIAEKD